MGRSPKKPHRTVWRWRAAFAACCLCGVSFSAFAQSGTTVWTNSYDGGSDDLVSAIAVDASGNVFVTGRSWGPGPYGYVYVFATVGYSSAGVPLWTNTYHGPANSWDGANAIATDTNGDVFVTGYSSGVGTSTDFTTLKYSNSGEPLWTNRYNGEGSGQDYASAMVVDGIGNVFVSGYSAGTGSDYDYATVCYSSSGQQRWVNRYNGPGNGYDRPQAMTLDAQGNVFVTGYSTGIGTGYDYATVAYSNDGLPLWTNRYDGPANGEDRATGIAVDPAGNVFVTGYSSNYNTGFSYLTIAYSNSGTPLWTNRWNGPGHSNDYGAAIVTDSRGEVFVTGSSYAGTGFSGAIYHYATLAYSNDGTPLWTNFYAGPAGYDRPVAIGVDAADNLIVTGSSMVNYPADVIATVAYTRTGVPLWTKQFPFQTECSGLALDGFGNILVTGYSVGGPTGDDYWVAKYAANTPALAHLDFQMLNRQLVLSWTNSSFALQATPALNLQFTTVVGATSPYTNVMAGSRRFFRLVVP